MLLYCKYKNKIANSLLFSSFLFFLLIPPPKMMTPNVGRMFVYIFVLPIRKYCTKNTKTHFHNRNDIAVEM